jgi:hypothetical protein
MVSSFPFACRLRLLEERWLLLGGRQRLAKSRLIPTTVMTQKQVGFNYLPYGLLLEICVYLDMESLVSLSQVRLQISLGLCN